MDRDGETQGQVTSFAVGAAEAGGTLAAALRVALGGIPWRRARDLCASGKVRVVGAVTRDPATRVAEGAWVEVDHAAPRPRAGTLAREAFVHVDQDVVVVRKPAGVATMRDAPGDKDSLADLTRAGLRRLPGERDRGDRTLGVVHRLDRDTTGLVVFARTYEAKRVLAAQFRAHEAAREYVAIVHGDARAARIESHLLPDRGDGVRGSVEAWRGRGAAIPAHAKRAVTHVTVRESLRGATCVECRLETGRQHQVRIHLAEAGHPLVGETVYVRDYAGPRIAAARPMLHAMALGFAHPRTGAAMAFTEPAPPDLEGLVAALRRG